MVDQVTVHPDKRVSWFNNGRSKGSNVVISAGGNTVSG